MNNENIRGTAEAQSLFPEQEASLENKDEDSSSDDNKEEDNALKGLSVTDRDQRKTEEKIKRIFSSYEFNTKIREVYDKKVLFKRSLHYHFAQKQIFRLTEGYSSIDCGMPWFSYWILNVLEMCKEEYNLSLNTKLMFVEFLRELKHKEGGFSGTPGGLANLISSYAAVMSIALLGIKEAYELIDIPLMHSFLMQMKAYNYKKRHTIINKDTKGHFLSSNEQPGKCSTSQVAYPGSFMCHYNGESDLRATYCALTIAAMLNILDDDIKEGVVDYIKSCQTFEGGLGPEPFCEAHGGYSFCGIASLILLNKLNAINVNAFLKWLVNRQMTLEGGFNGRTNKLVDSCYSFWQGATFNLLQMSDRSFSYDYELLYDQLSLQAYILFCCQEAKGGLKDKPGRRPDLHHSNYATAGFMCSQWCSIDKCKVSLSDSVENDLKELNPIYCIPESKARKAIKYYRHSTSKAQQQAFK